MSPSSSCEREAISSLSHSFNTLSLSLFPAGASVATRAAEGAQQGIASLDMTSPAKIHASSKRERETNRERVCSTGSRAQTIRPLMRDREKRRREAREREERKIFKRQTRCERRRGRERGCLGREKRRVMSIQTSVIFDLLH